MVDENLRVREVDDARLLSDTDNQDEPDINNGGLYVK